MQTPLVTESSVVAWGPMGPGSPTKGPKKTWGMMDVFTVLMVVTVQICAVIVYPLYLSKLKNQIPALPAHWLSDLGWVTSFLLASFMKVG